MQDFRETAQLHLFGALPVEVLLLRGRGRTVRHPNGGQHRVTA
jgi:hypothetical protein